MAQREIKPGDRVWVRQATISHQGDDRSGWWTSDGTNNLEWIASDRMLRDHPALMALERLLAEHGDALAAAVLKILSLTEIPWADEDGWVAKDLVKQLAAALGTEESGDGTR